MAVERTDPLAAGWAVLAEGDWDGARKRFEESLAERESPEALEGLGWVGHVLDDDRLTFDSRERAYRLSRIRLELAATLHALGREPAARREVEAALATCRALAAAGDVARAEAMRERYRARRAALPDVLPGPLGGLSRRELEVLALVAEGLTNQAIAERLVISEHTVHRHVSSILRKLGARSRSAAAALAAHHGLAPPSQAR